MLHSASNYETFWNIFARHYAQFCKIAACAGKKMSKVKSAMIIFFSAQPNKVRFISRL